MAAADGIAAIAATSHMMPDGAFANRRTTLLPLVSELQERLRRQGVDVAVYPGGEVYMSPDVIARLGAALSRRRLLRRTPAPARGPAQARQTRSQRAAALRECQRTTA